MPLLTWVVAVNVAAPQSAVSRWLYQAYVVAFFLYLAAPLCAAAIFAFNDLHYVLALARSGRFKPFPVGDMLEKPSSAKDVNYQNWRVLGSDYVVVGKVTPRDRGYVIQFQLLDVYRGQQVLGYSVPVSGNYLRRGAHQVSDLIYEELTGIPGAFSTRIAFVMAIKDGDVTRYQLVVADADGENQRTILRSFTNTTPIEAVPLAPAALAGLIGLVDKGVISSSIAKDVFAEMWASGKAPEQVVKEKGLEQVSDGVLQLNMGTLYPALMRLEQRGLLRGTWGTTDTSRRARFYALTAAGRRQLAREKQDWDRMAGIIQAVLHDER
mgnify:CR=1 FL=1